MLKVAKLFEEPEQSLIPPSREVNADDTTDKSLSKASVQPVTQPKAPTDLKTKKRRIPPSSKPQSPYKVRVILPKKQVAETQHAEVTVATADATKSLVAFKLAEPSSWQRSKETSFQLLKPKRVRVSTEFPISFVLNQNVEEEVKDVGFVAMEEVTFKQIIDEVDSKTQGAQENAESPYDTELEIKIIKSYQAATLSGTAETFHSSTDKPAQSDLLGHLQEELYFLNNKVDQMEASISKKVVEDIQSFVSTIDSIKTSILKSIAEELPQVDAQREQPSAQVVPNKEKALVVHNPKEKKSEGTVSMEDDSDEDDLEWLEDDSG
ncbi:hypothetical protein Tco_0628074 [Tanacetum coccineum]|uniref:Uncharacterized protein n=1 Tax=Tanacetum coccineum TaxID=301880 RepID=A0ABQ4WP99_9ASTR